jgi:hypothetical protein
MNPFAKHIFLCILSGFVLLFMIEPVKADEDSSTQETVTDQSSESMQSEAPETTESKAVPTEAVKDEREPKSLGHKLLFYIPNRVFDVLDVFRLRLRVGPGFSLSARATKPVSATLGAYTSIYAGLPGPRLKPTIKSPIWFENYAGLQVSVADASTSDSNTSPGYSNTEIGAGFQFLLAGIDIGADPVEIIDFITGLLFIQIRDDDF